MDGDRHLRHQQSASSDHGRALVPMWDSSDPDRAPPPLPLHPQSPSLTSRTGTSSVIQSAHAALNERARESAYVSSALSKRFEATSDKSPTRANSHRRMQSLQPGTVRDISLQIEGAQLGSNPASPTKNFSQSANSGPFTPSKSKDGTMDARTGDKDIDAHSNSSTPVPGPSITPILRPTARRPHQSILGENTPPQSATMLALQNMVPSTSRDADSPLTNVTNGSNAVVKVPQSLESLSSQILTLTNIATSLQKEMNQLSRRSRDNATDLLSLKEATNSRDEDIRKSLRDLITNVGDSVVRPGSRDPFSGGLYIDNKPHNAGPFPKPARPFSLPRIPSPNSFAASLDRESLSTPSLCGTEAHATVGLLEKVLRDMGTKTGQDDIARRLSEVLGKFSEAASSAKLEELADIVKARLKRADTAALTTGNQRPGESNGSGGSSGRPESRHLGLEDAARRLVFDADLPPITASQRTEQLIQDHESRRSSAPISKASDIVNEDMLKIIRSIKDSVSQGGGLTAEVKALVRELRGEVLGMGREIGRKLEQATMTTTTSPGSSGVGKTLHVNSSKDEVAQIIDEGLGKMKDQLNNILREHRRQSSETTTSRATAVDYDEVYNTLRAALLDFQSSQGRQADLSRDDVIEAVRQAWEDYKPDLEPRHVGLERDEVLACLKQGLDEHAGRSQGATREEVFKAMVEALKHFVPPRVDTPASLSRDEILEAVRECLEEFEFPVAPSAMNTDITRDDMVEAVKEGLKGIDFTLPSALVPTSTDLTGDDVASRFRELTEAMHTEFRLASEEAKAGVKTSERDADRVLDATNNALDRLRTDLESHIEQASLGASREEFMDAVLKMLGGFKAELVDVVAQMTVDSRTLLEGQIDHFRDTLATSVLPSTGAPPSRDELLGAIRDGLETLRSELPQPQTNDQPPPAVDLDDVRENLGELRTRLDTLIEHQSAPPPVTDLLIDEVRNSLNRLQADVRELHDRKSNEQAVVAVNDGALVPIDTLRHDHMKHLEDLITQLQVKVEAIELPTSQSATAGKVHSETSNEDSGGQAEELLHRLREALADTAKTRGTIAPAAADAASREDVEAIETILRNTKARLDDLIDGEQAVRKEHVDMLETALHELGETGTSINTHIQVLAQREDVASLETLVNRVILNFDELKDQVSKELGNPEAVRKSDTNAIEAVCSEIKSVLEKADIAELPGKEDVQALEALVRDTKDLVVGYVDHNSQTAQERQIEDVAVRERVSEVHTLLEEFRDMLKTKVEDGATGIEAIGTILDRLAPAVEKNASVRQDVKDMFELMKNEFDDSKARMVGAKLEMDEGLQKTTETLGSRFDKRLDELVSKHDRLLASVDEHRKASDARDAETESAVGGTKAVAEELKSLVDTLGSAVTDSLEKMEEASKTVFTQVEDLTTGATERHSEDKSEHGETRDQVLKTLTVVESIQGHVSDYQPRILEAVKDVLLLVGDHFEHAKEATTSLAIKIEESTPVIPPVEKYDDSGLHEKLDRLVDHTLLVPIDKYDDSRLHEKLDRLVDVALAPPPEKYDDSIVCEKLNSLVEYSEGAARALSRLDMFDEVHRQAGQTAKEITEFVDQQTKRIEQAHEDREKVLQDVNIALERRLTQTEEVEASLARLREEEEQLRQSVATLRADEQSLGRQKLRLAADVSSLETALLLRREELQEMESRAEGLERKILDGVMNHSRVLMMAQSTKPSEAMNRKRVRHPKGSDGDRSGAATTTAVSHAHAVSRAGLDMALSAKRNLAPPTSAITARRILSLGQMTNNLAMGIKRSHSVKTPGTSDKSLRKGSWTGALGRGLDGADKENIDLKESDEERHAAADLPDDDLLRRCSGGTIVITGEAPDDREYEKLDNHEETAEAVADPQEDDESGEGEESGEAEEEAALVPSDTGAEHELVQYGA